MKQCSTCQEQFADKFSFCPVDGTPDMRLITQTKSTLTEDDGGALVLYSANEEFEVRQIGKQGQQQRISPDDQNGCEIGTTSGSATAQKRPQGETDLTGVQARPKSNVISAGEKGAIVFLSTGALGAVVPLQSGNFTTALICVVGAGVCAVVLMGAAGIVHRIMDRATKDSPNNDKEN